MNFLMERGAAVRIGRGRGWEVLIAPRVPAMEAHERMDDTTFSSSLCNKLTTSLASSREPHIYLPTVRVILKKIIP